MERPWLVPVLSIYLALALFGAFVLSGEENAFWYQPLNVQFIVLLFAYAVDQWPIFGSNANLAKNLLVILLLISIPPLTSMITTKGIPTNVIAFWSSITIPMYLSMAFSARGDSVASGVAMLSSPIFATFATYYFYNPFFLAKTT